MDYEEANTIVFETDLENTLIQKGVSSEHIAYLKNKNPKNLFEYYNYYDRISEKDRKQVLVETKKIVGIDRTNKSVSFFDNATGRCKSELNAYKMATAIKHIKDDTLEKLYAWYKNLYYPVDLAYFSDDDIYDVGCDGNHRSLYANIVGAPQIKANIDYYRRNEEKYRVFLRYKSICSNYKLVSVSQNIYGDTEATFLYKGKEYVVQGYALPQIRDQYCEERIDILASQLSKDFHYLKNNWLIKYPLVKNIFLKYFCKDLKQASRLNQHIYQRNK